MPIPTRFANSSAALTLVLVLAGPGSAQEVRLEVVRRAHVSAARSAVPHVEPHLVRAADGSLVVAAMTYPPGGPPDRIALYRSEDEGGSWQPVDTPAEMLGADPWLIRAGNRLLLSVLPDRIWSSDDGGRRWRREAGLPGGGRYDYTKLAASADGSTVHAVTVTRDPMVFSSGDGGRSFAAGARLAVNRFNNQIGQPVVGPDGTLFVPFHEISSGGSFLESPRLWLVRSADGGRSFDRPVLVRENYTADSPSMAVDASGGPFHGRLYLGWMGRGSGMRHVVAHSEDEGVSWSAPVRLEAEADSTDPYPTHHPVLAVNDGGVLAASWLDARYDPEGLCHAPHAALSIDGGRTFGPDVALAEPSCARTPAHEVGAGGGEAPLWRRWRHGGDYHGMIALPGGDFMVVWADAASAVFQVRSARLRVAGDFER